MSLFWQLDIALLWLDQFHLTSHSFHLLPSTPITAPALLSNFPALISLLVLMPGPVVRVKPWLGLAFADLELEVLEDAT